MIPAAFAQRLGAPSETRLTAFAWTGWAAFVLVSAYVVMLVSAGRQGEWLTMVDGAPRAMDFTPFWAAGRLAWHGHASAAYHWPALHAEIVHATGRPFEGRFPFLYPPVFLLLMSPLGAAPFLLAAGLWLTIGVGSYLAAVWSILPRAPSLMIALAAPGVLYAVSIAQNGLLTAALAGGGLALLDRRPWIAGSLLGALVYKPHYAVLLPLVLLASGRLRALASAGLTAAVLVAVSAAAFGPEAYTAFARAAGEANRLLAEKGGVPWPKLQSVYAAARALGVVPQAAWGAHALAAGGAALATLLLWRSRAEYELKAAALAIATLVITPYSFVYDLPLLGIATVFLIRSGLRWRLSAAEMALTAAGATLPVVFYWVTFVVTPIACVLLGGVVALRLTVSARAPRGTLPNSPLGSTSA